MRIAKRIVAGVMLVLCVGAFWGGPRIGVELQALPALLKRPFVAGPVLVLVTLVFGRLFCESFCPFGILQSLVAWLRAPQRNVRRVCSRLPVTTRQWVVRSLVLVAFVVLAACGAMGLAATVEPYSLFGRAVSAVRALVCGAEANAAFWTGAVVVLVVLVLALLGKGRFWCNWICPLGTVFALFARKAPCGNRVGKGCANCRACFPSVKSGANAVPGEVSKAGVTRRETLKGVAVLAVAEKLTDGGFADVSLPGSPTRERPVLPPGAGEVSRFSRTCVACGLCVSACPERVLRPSVSLKSFGQPELDFRHGYCRTGCSYRCAEACPAGAIRLLSGVPKKDVHMGFAVWRKDLCLRTTEGVSCTACQRKCPVRAVKLVSGFPVVDRDACLGCGACEHVCPVRPEPAIRVMGLARQRVVRPVGTDDLAREMDALLDSGEASVVVAKDGVIVAKEKGRGVVPLLKLYRQGVLRGAIVSDLVTGRAAASLCIAGGVAKVRSHVLAANAAELLDARGVPYEARETVPAILDRTRSGSCPLERTIEDLTDPDEMAAALDVRDGKPKPEFIVKEQ